MHCYWLLPVSHHWGLPWWLSGLRHCHWLLSGWTISLTLSFQWRTHSLACIEISWSQKIFMRNISLKVVQDELIPLQTFWNITQHNKSCSKLKYHVGTLDAKGLILPACVYNVNPSNAKATFIQTTRMERWFEKTSKPCHVGIHLSAFAECFQMSTHLPGFLSFMSFLCIILYWPN